MPGTPRFEAVIKSLWPGQTVFTRGGHRLGQIQAAGCAAFRVAPTAEQPGFWLVNAAVERTTLGGLVFLVADLEQLDAYRWVRPLGSQP